MEIPRVVSNPKILGGKPVIEGTRISVELILERMAQGESPERLFKSYPHLPAGSISAALRFAVAVMKNEEIITLERQTA
jgi:uncharacterized protein (DUF433 family)